MMLGKIAVFNSQNGKGIIILENNEKLDFDLYNWNDNNIPKINDEVEVLRDNNSILSISLYHKKLTQNEKINNLLSLAETNFLKINFKVIQSSKNILELEKLEETYISIFYFLLHTFWISFLLFFIFGGFSVLVGVVIAYFLSKRKKVEHILIYEEKEDFVCF